MIGLALVFLTTAASVAIGFVCIPSIKTFFTALLSATMFGFVSPLISARRLYFLAVEASHIALLSVLLAIILSNVTPIKNETLWSVVLGLLLIYVAGLAIYKGLDPDVATAIITAVSVSGSVSAMHLILTRYRVNYSLWNTILGDPLLITWRDLYVLAALTTATVIISIAIYRVIIYIGVDRDGAMLVFKNLKVYEFLFFTALGLSSVALLKIVGYVLEHVLLTLPSLIAMKLVEGGKRIMFASVCISISVSALGFSLSMWLGIAPAGAVGFIALAAYALSIAVDKVGRAWVGREGLA